MEHESPQPLLSTAREVRETGKSKTLSPRELMRWYDAYRRGRNKVQEVRASLRNEGLETWSDFTSVHFDVEIELRLRSSTTNNDGIGKSARATSSLNGEAALEPDYDMAPRLAQLAAANSGPLCVTRDEPIDRAVTLMMQHGYTQLPVMQGNRNPDGYISWKTIGCARAKGRELTYIRDAMRSKVLVLRADTHLFDAVARIADSDFCLVEGVGRRIVGLVTTYDITFHSDDLARPFLLIPRIEGHLRSMIAPVFGVEELRAAKNEGDEGRNVETVSDLTFGEYQRLLQEPSNWERLNLKIDRVTFDGALSKVRDVRNAVMHFDPDAGEEHLKQLQSIGMFLEELVG